MRARRDLLLLLFLVLFPVRPAQAEAAHPDLMGWWRSSSGAWIFVRPEGTGQHFTFEVWSGNQLIGTATGHWKAGSQGQQFDYQWNRETILGVVHRGLPRWEVELSNRRGDWKSRWRRSLSREESEPDLPHRPPNR